MCFSGKMFPARLKNPKKPHTQFSEDILWIEMKVPMKVIYTHGQTKH